MIEPELLEEFLTESTEHLASVEDDVLALERGDATTETVNRLFRALHTVKGAASFLNLKKVTTLAHALEEVVGKFREGTLVPSEEIVDSLLKGIDDLKHLLNAPDDEEFQIERVVIDLLEISRGRAIQTRTTRQPGGMSPEIPEAEGQVEVSVSAAPYLMSAARKSTGCASLATHETQPHPLLIPSSPPRVDTRPSSTAPGGSEVKVVDTEQTVRIPLVLLDKLMNLASELVLVRNQHMQAVTTGGTPEQLTAIAQRLSVVTTELQTGIMQTRMRPITPVFNRFVRVIRDLGKKLGKEIDLHVSGTDVELDKNIIEAIGDPLTHLIRNAADHGIETPAERRAVGKPLRGKVHLSAAHQAGQVVIKIEDDGRGMDREALKITAVERGLISSEKAQRLADRDAYNLIFLPGFTTAGSVTDVSGRGVGMDAVRAAFNRIGGVIDVTSTLNKGTCVTIKLPLTLAIVPVLIVAVENLRFAIPQVSIDEVVLLYGAAAWQELKVVDDQEVYWLRGKLLPVLRLAKILGIQKTYIDPKTGVRKLDRRAQKPDRRQEREAGDDCRRQGVVDRRVSVSNSFNIVVIKLGSEQFGLLVDTIIDTEEIVVKSLHDQLKPCGAYAGTTVLGDGNIAMILDVAALIELGRLRFMNFEGEISRRRSSGAAHQTVLLFNIGGSETFAVPLCLITRVEEIRSDQIQVADVREHLAYRGGVMPLVRIERAISSFNADYRDRVYVIIPRGAPGVGIVVSSIMDTIEIPCEVDTQSLKREGVFGSLLHQGTLILLLDLLKIIEMAAPGTLEKGRNGDASRKLLLVEDSAFYSALLEPYLKSVGFDVSLVENGEQALTALRETPYDLVVSDIEMPIMDGFELVRHVRASAELADIHMIAISAIEDETLATHALDAGFDEFESKLDQARLLTKMSKISMELRKREGISR